VKRAWLGLALATLAGAAAAAQEAAATLRFEPASAAVGEPVRALLSVTHARAAAPALSSLGLDDSWVVFEAGARRIETDASGRTTSSWEFEIASLEPGERRIENIPLKLGEAQLQVEAGVLAVSGVLAAGEDAPRETRGLPELDLEERGGAGRWLAIGALAAVALGFALWLALRKRRPAMQAVPAPSSRLALLEAKPLDTAQEVQAAHFALTRLLREAADLRLGRDRSGLTDEEWRAASIAQFDAAGLDERERQLLEQLLDRAGAVKYGAERPTHWATREALASARALAARLEPRAEAAA